MHTHVLFEIICSEVEIIEIGRKNKSEETFRWLKDRAMVLCKQQLHQQLGNKTAQVRKRSHKTLPDWPEP